MTQPYPSIIELLGGEPYLRYFAGAEMFFYRHAVKEVKPRMGGIQHIFNMIEEFFVYGSPQKSVRFLMHVSNTHVYSYMDGIHLLEWKRDEVPDLELLRELVSGRLGLDLP